MSESDIQPEDRAWLTKKKDLLESIPVRGRKKSWHRAMKESNDAIQQLVQSSIKRCDEKLNALKRKRKGTNLLTSREFSFLLHPPSLVDVLKRISAEASAKFV